MARSGSDGDSDDAMQYSKPLRQQKKLCDEAMELVNAGVAMQNASPPDTAGADAKLSRAVTLMEQALTIEYPTQEERDASQRLNNKMNRYVKMIRSQREKGATGGATGRGHNTKFNILPMDNLPSTYNVIVELLNNSSTAGDIFESMKATFGFQEANVTNQKEHVLLMLTNFKLQEEEPNQNGDEHHQLDHQQELDMANKGIKRFHERIFANYVKWCKYVSTKPAFTSDPLVDIVVFFLIWGEAGNFRQTPECLCFLLHTSLPQASSRGGSKNPGDFLAEVIRPMYNEVKKDNDKKTAQGARAPHGEIRNYDDFNEFFWSKKCLKYNPTTIHEAFGEVDKKGRPKVIKKSFVEKRTWFRALMSFRRIFCFNCALFMAVLGFSLNVVMYCPDTPILYGADLGNGNSRGFTVFGKNMTASDYTAVGSGDGSGDKSSTGSSGPTCNHQMLATCLGMTYTEGIFESIPIDFKALLQLVPFTDCVEKSTGRCGCYLDLIDNCFTETGQTTKVTQDELAFSSSSEFDQSMCVVNWRAAVESIIKDPGPGKLNCEICQLDIKALITNGKIGDLVAGLISVGDGIPLPDGDITDTKRTDMGALAMFGGVGCLGLVCACEFLNKIFSRVGSGYVGRSLPVPIRAYCRYTCFWLLLFACKLTFDYQYMMKALVETTLFIWYANEDEYLKYSNFILQMTFHNIIYILFLWIPAFFVFMYDAQIFYSVLSVIFGSFAGFNLRIGELRSFRVLRLSFKSIPRMFNKKIVPNIQDGAADGKKKKKKKKKGEKEDSTMPVRHFERVSMADGIKPLTVKAQMYSNLLDQHGEMYNEVKTPNDKDDASSSGRQSQLGSVTGVSGADFERTIPFAMAWNRCLGSLREADVISDRELNVLSYLIDSKDAEDRKLYPPAFLTAGKLDESLDIIVDCSTVYEKLSSDKKKKEKTLQKIENTMRERLTKDDLRVESILGSYKFTSQAVRFLLGDEHKDLNECFEFMEEMAAQQSVLKGLNLKSLHECRAACAELMKALLEVPKTTSDNSIKFQRALYRVIDCVESVLNCMKKILVKQENLVQILTDTPLKQSSFFFPGDAQQYANMQLQRLVNSEAALDIVSRAYQLLTVDNFDAEPRSEEGRRRLRFFANSLFMDMPEAKPIRKIRSLTVSTPYYNEIVLYSIKDLTAQNDDSIKLIYYLKTIYPFEWENLLERLQAKDMEEALKKFPEEVQLWASYRGQTLARTVRGMMYNEDAIRFLHWLEICENEVMHQPGCPCNKCKRLNEMVALKFNYVCTCQIYGKQKDEQRQQAADLEYLLRKHPNLRVAYVDGPKKMKEGPPKFFSVLVRADGENIAEVYRVELPGNPVIGEGKPENQNHAIIFSRGELLQCIDMNQDGYLEEALKMPNLLSTKDSETKKCPLTIIGFREHVFTGGVSNLASFMSIQELSFVSLGQRMLALNHVRQHYGHPDIFDKLFAMGCGGTAKASKGVNLSEDIFAGFNSTLRGGRVSHEEFIQVGKGRDVGMQQLTLFEAKLSSGAGECVISRDAMRMASRLDFFRLHSWFYGNLGWYFTQTMTVVGVYFFIYGKVYMALSGMDSYFLEKGGLGIGGTLNTSWAFQFGFLLVVPVVAVVGVEQGFRHGVTYLIWNILTLGPLFFTFQMGTRMHYFDRTLIHGGAKYRATGRGFTIKHERFAELYRFYAFSHFYRAVELVFLLILFRAYGTFSWCNCSWTQDAQFYNYYKPSDNDWNTRCYANYYQTCVEPTNQNYGVMSYSLWIIAATWLWAPFFFNPSGFDWDKLIEDYSDWQNWLKTTNDSAASWSGWWSNEMEYLEHSTRGSRIVSMIRKMRFFFVAYGMYLQLAYKTYYEDQDLEIEKGSMISYALSGLMFILVLLLLCCGYIASRVKKKMTFKQKKLRKMKFVLSCCGLLVACVSLLVLSIINLIEIAVIILIAAYWFLQLCIYRNQTSHVVVRGMARSYDRWVGWIIFGPVLFIAMFLPFLASFQQRVMFNNAFTSGLEVSKLFANEAASSTSKIVKVKRVAKKKKRSD
ncbi:Callose synthase 1 [Phytophthora fragariae]|uniref:1,3-beta-glucan synthase n=1 Tax=Phytophthora fragariae TaxID=53985 RepID=A0A6A3TLP6_9STRA|nr:Callose synthase 1 [Phytophthora fragariae]KAE8947994.1 Callose synthase 1 [Phytophthora fragariae]KAE9028525.1 Callose synthase 1 [Phytophthora fragariae]KAE9136311.1 Callose synthase 1 [Phytophthora fragariae]KAE9136427.1 Callose synthase 1 [Phytophthora fragariae]